MSRIQGFPKAMLRTHARWHMMHMNEAKSGEGVAFLEFHRKFIAKFHSWYDSQSFAKSAAFAEPGVGDPSTAPQFTEFWKLHGLIDSWRARWQKAHP